MKLMRCPACGYPNPEEARTCFQCGGPIDVSRAISQNGTDAHAEAKSRRKGLFSRSTASEAWWVWLIGIALVAVAFILPWGSLLVYERTGPYEGTLAFSSPLSLLDLTLSGDIMVTGLAWAFIIGLLFCIIFPKMVIIPLGALVLLPFFMPDYALTKLPPEYQSSLYYVDSNMAVGYFFAWLATFILGTLALTDFTLRFTNSHGKDQSPMERLEPNNYSWLWFYRKR
jgi:hypothetical protein